MPQCIAKSSDGKPCQSPAQSGYKYCSSHLRQRNRRRYASAAGAIGLALGVWAFLANTAGVLSFFGYTLTSWSSNGTKQLVRPTPVVVSALGQTEVSFWVEKNIIDPGECVVIRWDVEHVERVYFEGEDFKRKGVSGHDSHRVCPAATSAYTLTVEAKGQSHSEARTVALRSELPHGKIAFTSDRLGEWRIFALTLGDEDKTLQVTEGANRDSLPVNDWDPSWSPDGSAVAFESGREGEFDIFTYMFEKSKIRRLTSAPGMNLVAVWSPQGDSIAFQSDRSGNFDIYVMKIDGSGVRRLTDHPGPDMWPSWSPDGQQLVFEAKRTDTGKTGLYTMSRLGNNVQPLLVDDWNNGQPAWGSRHRIAFYSDRDGNKEIYTIDVASREIKRITSNPGDDWFPTWSPDGRWIAFTSSRDGNLEIYATDVDGKHLLRLTDNASQDRDPAWSVP